MISKIQPHHHQKMAYVYLRQSTMGQVRHHQESTARQYALKDRALKLGWQNDQIRVLDRDLGLSGTQTNNREDFKTLVADVSLEKVGAVFALEASRLSRSCSDWHRMLEICALTGTLLVDEDGCYDPADFNDQLLLDSREPCPKPSYILFARASRAANAIKPGAESCVSSYPSDTSMERSRAAC